MMTFEASHFGRACNLLGDAIVASSVLGEYQHRGQHLSIEWLLVFGRGDMWFDEAVENFSARPLSGGPVDAEPKRRRYGGHSQRRIHYSKRSELFPRRQRYHHEPSRFLSSISRRSGTGVS